jgi:hypothetical protein
LLPRQIRLSVMNRVSAWSRAAPPQVGRAFAARSAFGRHPASRGLASNRTILESQGRDAEPVPAASDFMVTARC